MGLGFPRVLDFHDSVLSSEKGRHPKDDLRAGGDILRSPVSLDEFPDRFDDDFNKLLSNFGCDLEMTRRKRIGDPPVNKMTPTRAARRKKEIEKSKERTELRYQMSFNPFETEDGEKAQTKIGGATRRGAPQWSERAREMS